MVSLIIGDTGNILDGILDGRLELAVVGAKTETKKLVQEKLIEDEMRLIDPADHQWAVEPVKIRNLIGFKC